MDLLDYVQKTGGNKPGRRCTTCSLDEGILAQIHAGRRATPKVPYPVIARWLEAETGQKIQPNTIRNHFIAGHVDD